MIDSESMKILSNSTPYFASFLASVSKIAMNQNMGEENFSILKRMDPTARISEFISQTVFTPIKILIERKFKLKIRSILGQ